VPSLEAWGGKTLSEATTKRCKADAAAAAGGSGGGGGGGGSSGGGGGSLSDCLEDELLFRGARALLIAEFQIVTYNEYLLALVGNGHANRYGIRTYGGYRCVTLHSVCVCV